MRSASPGEKKFHLKSWRQAKEGKEMEPLFSLFLSHSRMDTHCPANDKECGREKMGNPLFINTGPDQPISNYVYCRNCPFLLRLLGITVFKQFYYLWILLGKGP